MEHACFYLLFTIFELLFNFITPGNLQNARPATALLRRREGASFISFQLFQLEKLGRGVGDKLNLRKTQVGTHYCHRLQARDGREYCRRLICRAQADWDKGAMRMWTPKVAPQAKCCRLADFFLHVQKAWSRLKFGAKGRFSQVRGEFNLHSDNHGKPVYKKNGQAWLFGIFLIVGVSSSDHQKGLKCCVVNNEFLTTIRSLALTVS